MSSLNPYWSLQRESNRLSDCILPVLLGRFPLSIQRHSLPPERLFFVTLPPQIGKWWPFGTWTQGLGSAMSPKGQKGARYCRTTPETVRPVAKLRASFVHDATMKRRCLGRLVIMALGFKLVSGRPCGTRRPGEPLMEGGTRAFTGI